MGWWRARVVVVVVGGVAGGGGGWWSLPSSPKSWGDRNGRTLEIRTFLASFLLLRWLWSDGRESPLWNEHQPRLWPLAWG